MELQAKFAVLADAAKYDASCSSNGSSKRSAVGGGIGSIEGAGICQSYTPDGRCISLLKILLTNFCVYDCKYCINRVNIPCARYSVVEVVNLTLDYKLLAVRRWRRLCSTDIERLRAPTSKVLPFVECQGWSPSRSLDDPLLAAKLVQPMAPASVQASLFWHTMAAHPLILPGDGTDFSHWRYVARWLWAQQVPPEAVRWHTEDAQVRAPD